MSLTSTLSSTESSAKNFKKILNFITPKSFEFKTYSNNLAFSRDYTVFAPYNLRHPIEARLIGVAFDFLARFILSRYTNTKINLDHLYCKNALNIINESKIHDKYFRHIKIIENFHQGNANNLDVMSSVIFFSHLEYVARSGIFDQKIYDSLYRTPADYIVEDLKTQGNVFFKVFIQSGIVQPDSHITYSPNFGHDLTAAVGGIDSDISIDTVLYDLKTTKSFGYSKNYAIQIMSYYLFHLLDKLLYDKTDLQQHSIERIALYKSRFGEIEFFDIKSIKHRMMTETLLALNSHLKLGINPFRIRDLTDEMLTNKQLCENE